MPDDVGNGRRCAEDEFIPVATLEYRDLIEIPLWAWRDLDLDCPGADIV
jgi:hypothetical protein